MKRDWSYAGPCVPEEKGLYGVASGMVAVASVDGNYYVAPMSRADSRGDKVVFMGDDYQRGRVIVPFSRME